MAKRPSEILADALQAASNQAVNNVIYGPNLDKKPKNILIKEGFLKPILRGWYLLDADLSTQDTGDSILWSQSYWGFVSQYLEHSVGEDYILSAEQSLDIHTGSNKLPTQLLIANTKKVNRIVNLPRSMSFSLFSAVSLPNAVINLDGIRLYSLADALVKVGPTYFRKQSKEIRLALGVVPLNDLLHAVLESGNVDAASRLAGAYHAMGMMYEGDEILSVMHGALYSVTAKNPFEEALPSIQVLRPTSPYATRLQLLWVELRDQLRELVGQKPKPPADINKALDDLEERYVTDAYHSLSIEGYQVTPDLIDKVRSGNWNPDSTEDDKKQLNAMAARGYYDAHLAVKEFIVQIHQHGVGVADLRKSLATWYRSLFGPMVKAGTLNPVDLAGYRNRPVFIRGSRHTPLPAESLLDAMEVLFELIASEEHPMIQALLGHFFIGYIHPFPDGNGRCARFMMNALLVAGGYEWTIIKVDDRQEYMEALEAASIDHSITKFFEVIQKATD